MPNCTVRRQNGGFTSFIQAAPRSTFRNVVGVEFAPHHENQLEDGYFLPACAPIVLVALDVPLSQQAITLRLQTGNAGFRLL